MIDRTKYQREYDKKDIEFQKHFERKYGVRVILEECRRVDRSEIEQATRELYRSAVFKNVKISLEEQVVLRYWYYINVVGLSRKNAILRLCNCDFLRGERLIERLLSYGKSYLEDVENCLDLGVKMPLFIWDIKECKKALRPSELLLTKEVRKSERERLICAYYYFYSECLGYSDVDSEYVVCYRDFCISPNQLKRIISDNEPFLSSLYESEATREQLCDMFPNFAWDSSISFNDESNIPDECDYVINTINMD